MNVRFLVPSCYLGEVLIVLAVWSSAALTVGFEKARLEKLLADASSGKVPFGASVADAARILSRQGRIPIFGAYVGKVSPGSPAERAGLAPGDIITELNVRPVTNAEGVATALAALPRGARVAVVWTRADRVLRSEVSL